MRKIICCLLTATLIAAIQYPALATTRMWTADGKVINDTQGVIVRGGPQTCAAVDAGGNRFSIAAFSDGRGGKSSGISQYYQVYLQKVSQSDGTLNWGTDENGDGLKDGIPIATGYAYYEDVQITAIGNSVIVTWSDLRSGTRDIYAQKVDINGNILWTSGGVPVCTYSAIKSTPRITAASDGAIIVWQDSRNGNLDLYGQKITTANGAIAWTGYPNGRPICTATGTQSDQRLIPDGNDGAFIAWTDYRDYGTTKSDIYAHLVLSNGNFGTNWAANGNLICNAVQNQYDQVLTGDGSGNFIIVWSDARQGTTNYDVYAQKIMAATGAYPVGAGWAANGMVICNLALHQYEPAIATDNAGGAIIAWADNRNSATTGLDIYALRIDGNGAAVAGWSDVAFGVLICNASSTQTQPNMISDGSNGVIMAWYDGRNGVSFDLYAQKVSGNATIGGGSWPADGYKLNGAGTVIMNTALLSMSDNGAGGGVIAWLTRDATYFVNRDIYAKNMTNTGASLWGATEKPVCVGNGPIDQTIGSMVKNGSGGGAVVWLDKRNNKTGIYAQKFDSSGTKQWASDGVTVFSEAYPITDLANPDICRLSSGDYIIICQYLDDNGYTLNLATQKIANSNGATMWANPVYVMNDYGSDDTEPCIISTGTEAVIAWARLGNIFAKKIDGDGNIIWGGASNTADTQLSTLGDASNPAIGRLASGLSSLVVWHINDDSDHDVYGRTITDLDATMGAETALASGAGNQIWPDVADFNSDNAPVVVWSDNSQSAGAYYEIYAQKFNASLVGQWSPARRLSAASDTSHNIYPRITKLNNDILAATWQRGPVSSWGTGSVIVPVMSSGQIYTQTVDQAGTTGLASPFQVATSATNKEFPDVADGGSDTALICWDHDIMAQKVYYSEGTTSTSTTTTTTTTSGSSTTTTTTTTTTSTTTTLPGTPPSIDDVSGKELISESFTPAAGSAAAGTSHSASLIGAGIALGAGIAVASAGGGGGDSDESGSATARAAAYTRTIQATNVHVSPDGTSASFNVTFPADPGAIGYWDVIVTNPDGQSAVYANAIRVEPPVGLYFYPNTVSSKVLKAAGPSSQARVAYTLASDMPMDIYIYDVKQMRVVYHRKYASGQVGGQYGYNEILFDGTTDFGATISNGTYILQAFSNGNKVGQTYFVVID